MITTLLPATATLVLTTDDAAWAQWFIIKCDQSIAMFGRYWLLRKVDTTLSRATLPFQQVQSPSFKLTFQQVQSPSFKTPLWVWA